MVKVMITVEDILTAIGLGSYPRRNHLFMPFAPLLILRHLLREPQEVQVHIPFCLPSLAFRSALEVG